MHYKTTFSVSHNSYMKSMEFYENCITLFSLERKKLSELSMSSHFSERLNHYDADTWYLKINIKIVEDRI